MAKAKKAKKPKETFRSIAAAGDYTSDPGLRGILPDDILDRYQVRQWKHAAAILKTDFAGECSDIVKVLGALKLPHSHIVSPGGGESKISQGITSDFGKLGWKKKKWDTKILVDDSAVESPTHIVDCYKNRVALEFEWSNKDPFYDRDLNNFRLLFDLRTISVGVIVTKSDELATLFYELGVFGKYGTTTTWMSKLLPRVKGGGGGGCPLLVFGLRKSLYVPKGS